MPRDAVSRTANVERNGGHKWVKINMPLQVPVVQVHVLPELLVQVHQSVRAPHGQQPRVRVRREVFDGYFQKSGCYFRYFYFTDTFKYQVVILGIFI